MSYRSQLDFQFDPKPNPRWRWGLALCCGLLTACSGPSEGDRMAQTIQQDVIRQGGNSLKAVVCPKEVKPQVGETLECTGELDTGYVFTIPVKWKDDKGGFTWEIPNAKGLLNITKFEGMIQEGVKNEVGSAVVRCGTTLYRAVRAGEKFDCQLAVKPGAKPAAKPGDKPGDKPEEKSDKPEGESAQGEPPKPSKPDKIAVSVDTDRNISWQRLIAGEPQKPAPSASPAATPGSATAAPQASASPSSASATPASASESKSAPSATGDSGKPAPAAQSNAEEFLNQSGASNNFED